VQSSEGEALAKQMGCDFTEASAKTCVNVEKGMTSLSKQQHLFNLFFTPSAFYSVVRQIRKKKSNSKKGGSSSGGGASGKKEKKGLCVLL